MSTELNVPTTIIGKDTDEILFGNVLNNSIYACGGNDGGNPKNLATPHLFTHC
jgi:hypothetical protein